MNKFLLFFALSLAGFTASAAQEVIFSCPPPETLAVERSSTQPNADWNITGVLRVQLKNTAPRQIYYEVSTFIPDSVVTLVGKNLQIYGNDHIEYSAPYLTCVYKSNLPSLELVANNMAKIGKNCQVTQDQAAVRCEV